MKPHPLGATFLAIAAAWLLIPSSAMGQSGQVSTTDILRERALADSTGYGLVEDLTTRFGARPAGSVSEAAAAHWGAGRLAAMGFAKVAIEPFPLRLWNAGTSSASVVAPGAQSLVVTPLGGSTGGSAEAPAAVFPTYADFIKSDAVVSSGKVVVILEAIAPARDGGGYSRALAMRMAGPGEAARRGAVGYLMRSLNTQGARTASSGATSPTETAFPAFALSPPDAEQLERLSRAGPIRLRLASTAGWRGVGQSQNVVAEIKGSDTQAKPVLISAHLDSWEQGTGAVDDGFGLAVVTAAAKLIGDLPTPPRRTIRIVWFGSEEISQPAPVGSFAGARAYTDRHRTELANLALVAESDGGGGKIFQLAMAGREDSALVGRLRSALSPLGVGVSLTPPRIGEPDISVLQAAGVPAFRLMQDATSQYDTHHNANDVLGQIDRAALAQNIAAWTVTLWLIADSDTELGPDAKP